ncbi:MAG: hypothetical protein IPL39_24735 [Opitutaceae bacterium]|nr:hypothetical protein [Opitutaceae bacterium]
MLRVTLLPLPLMFACGGIFFVLEANQSVPQLRRLAAVLLCAIPLCGILEIAAFACDTVMSHGELFGWDHWPRLVLHGVGLVVSVIVIWSTVRLLSKGIPICM